MCFFSILSFLFQTLFNCTASLILFFLYCLFWCYNFLVGFRKLFVTNFVTSHGFIVILLTSFVLLLWMTHKCLTQVCCHFHWATLTCPYTKANIHLLDFDVQFANSTQKIDPYLPIATFATSFLHLHCLSIASRFLSSNLSHWVKRTSTTLFVNS